MGFQSWSGTNTALVYFAYCCVTFYTPSLLLYPPPYPRSPLSLPSYHHARHRHNPDISPAQGYPPTWVSPLSVPESPASTQVHLPTWASPTSVPEYQHPHEPASPPTACSYHPVAYSCIPKIFPPRFTYAVSLALLVATMHTSCALPLHSLYPLCIPQIYSAAPPNVTPSPVFF